MHGLSRSSGRLGRSEQGLADVRGQHPGLFGNRNSPSAAYASFSPDFHYDAAKTSYVGGQFWDGRAKNVADQAKGPILNRWR